MASPYGSTRISLAGMTPGLALLGWHWSWHCWDWPRSDGTRMVLLGLASPRHRWDWSCWDWPHWDSTEMASLGQWHRDSPGMASLGWWHWGSPGTALPQGHWDQSCWDGLAGMASGWPGQDGTRVASPGRHWGGLPGTRDLSLSPHNCPIQGWGDPRPPLLPRRSLWAQGSRGLGLPAVGLEPSMMMVLAIAALGEAAGAGGLCSAAGRGLKACLCTSSFPPLKFPNP